jgi:L-ribulose-5-phosphate 3-epimerase
MQQQLSRRALLKTGLAAGAATLTTHALAPWLTRTAAAKGVKFKVGVTDWNLKQTGKLEAIALAKQLGFDGVQVSIGRGTAGMERLPLADPELQQKYLAESKRIGLPITSLCLDVLHRNGLKSDPLGARWVADSIPIAKALGVKVILLPFFGNWALKTQAEMDYVGDALREIAPAAEKAKVILGLEDTISARDNIRIVERSRSSAVRVYYDVGNSTVNGFDIIEELRWLGGARICEVHLKDNPHYMGKGKIDFKAVIAALSDISFDQWAVLETSTPSGSVENDMTVNLKFVRELIAAQKA